MPNSPARENKKTQPSFDVMETKWFRSKHANSRCYEDIEVDVYFKSEGLFRLLSNIPFSSAFE